MTEYLARSEKNVNNNKNKTKTRKLTKGSARSDLERLNASLAGPVHISMAKTTANVKIKRKKKIMNFTSPGRKRTVIMEIESKAAM